MKASYNCVSSKVCKKLYIVTCTENAHFVPSNLTKKSELNNTESTADKIYMYYYYRYTAVFTSCWNYVAAYEMPI